jgi:hypothetical protein
MFLAIRSDIIKLGENTYWNVAIWRVNENFLLATKRSEMFTTDGSIGGD